VWEIRPEDKVNWAPDPFPLALPARCICAILGDRKGKVIDPYAGSGTTLVAAKLLGHEFFGIEISEQYTKLALERLANAELERKELEEELSLHQVRLTFKDRKALGMTKPPNRKAMQAPLFVKEKRQRFKQIPSKARS
jgi:DNA modification methylase